jgi:hypothetical protein
MNIASRQSESIANRRRPQAWLTELRRASPYSAFLATCCDTNLLDIPQVKIAWASAEPLLRDGDVECTSTCKREGLCPTPRP